MIAALDIVKLSALMQRTSGRPDIAVALIDGPVNTAHPHLSNQRITEIPGIMRGTCARADSRAHMRARFVVLLVRPIFQEALSVVSEAASAFPEELAAAIIDCVEAKARVINLSLTLTYSSESRRTLRQARDCATIRSIVTVAAAGNRGAIGRSAITPHPWMNPITACDLSARRLSTSDIAPSIGRFGLLAPGDAIKSLAGDGGTQTPYGTSATPVQFSPMLEAQYVDGVLLHCQSGWGVHRRCPSAGRLVAADRHKR